ncbi:helix-turn-helix domain-containing protein [Frankia sp. AgB1.9]|nr:MULTISPECIES: helix-turn-helix domain-containing protein [unclassified Frankia]MBL7487620.1 helix-turn-helix domain-containing protein [Frankia sp. AgW1.1]MBL7548914.1 helix-turn-helix domain-containing protein [Frankia sp. AgB1.9]MBL7624882.1 helix-turn-helix domain-containing protein [Frankia sp. AgB1.8]
MEMTDSRPAKPHTARGPVDGEDWLAVANWLNSRMAERRIGQQQLADAAGVSVATVRVLQRGAGGRRVQNETLAAICRALGWPDNHLLRVLVSDPDAAGLIPADTAAQLLAAVLRIERQIDRIENRL